MKAVLLKLRPTSIVDWALIAFALFCFIKGLT